MKIFICYFTVANLIGMLKMVQCDFNTSDQKGIFEASPSSSHEEGSCLARLDILERKVDHQNREVGILRTEHEELKTIFKTLKNTDNHQLRNYEDTMETTVLQKQNTGANRRIILKKPARLLPLSLFQKLEPRNTSDDVAFSDPPTNCRDLSYIGYTLNGFYPVQLSPVGEQKFGKIGMIYCNFKPSESIVKGTRSYVEKRVGFLDVKSSSVHFYVQKNIGFDQPNKVIPFEIALLNEGQAMNLKTGTFQAPLNGIYYFSFRGLLGAPTSLFSINTQIFLRLNGKIVATGVSSSLGGFTFSLECTLKLKKGDRVDVKMGKSGALMDNEVEHLTHFSGHLIEEDLAMLKN